MEQTNYRTRENNEMRKAYSYYRVSTPGQVEDGMSLEVQQKLCYTWANDNAFTVIEEFVEEGRTATSINRPILKEMLAKCQERDIEIDAILIQDSDRLNRNLVNHLTIKAILGKRNIQLIAINQPQIDSSPEGTLLDNILGSINQFQSELTGRKTSKVMQAKAEIGWYPGGQPMLGYRNITNPHPTCSLDKRIIDLDPEIAPFIKICFEMYSTGSYNTQQIADYLNSKNIPSPLRCKIHRSYVVRMLRSEFYIGIFNWNKKRYDEANHPHLI